MPFRSVRPLAAALALALVAPLTATAQTESSGYVPPKLSKRGTTSIPLSGPGTVVVKVFVKKDGSATVSGVIKSSNKDDEAAALDVAKNSTYVPATRAGAKIDAFYDYTIVFTINGETDTGPKTGLPAYEQMLRTGNYAGAKSGLESYLQQHPDDARANADLGAANTYTNDFPAAVAAFDKAGDGIPQTLHPVASDAYSGYAASLIGQKNTSGALVAAKRAVDLNPGFGSYNTLGVVQFSSGDSTSAIASFQKALSLDQNVKQSERDAANVNLAMAYADAGKFDEAKQAAAQVSQLTAAQKAQLEAAESVYYIKQGEAAEKAGKADSAAAIYQQGAAAAPSQAAAFYVRASSAYLSTIKDAGSNDTKDTANQKAKAMADKALAIDPNNAEASYDAGIASAGLGQKAQALTYLNKAQSAAAGSSDSELKSAIQKALQTVNDMR